MDPEGDRRERIKAPEKPNKASGCNCISISHLLGYGGCGRQLLITSATSVVYHNRGRSLRLESLNLGLTRLPVGPLFSMSCVISETSWLDEEDLLAGQQWRSEIPKAVRRSDAVLVCLSQRAVDKSGFVQKEITVALDALDEKPEGSIYLLPVKLEECRIPERLAGIHAISLEAEAGFARLLKALRARAEQLKVTQ